MAKYQDQNILFTNVTYPSFLTSGRISKGRYTTDGNNNITQTTGPLLNAIDIDWNGAYLSSANTYINTTGELISQINIIYESLNNLSNNLSGYLQSSDITLEFLNSILGETYANKSIENRVTELSNALSNKADLSDIPTSIYQLDNADNFATIAWVNNQLRTYSRSAYDVYKERQISLNQSYLSVSEWLESLKGEPGLNGSNGKSAYELAVENGFVGTKDDWIRSLKGEKGEKGDVGPSINILGYYNTLEELKNDTLETINGIGDAYNVNGVIYVYNDGFTSINDKWKSAGQFKGEQGEQGKSAYDIYCEIQESLGHEPLGKEEWLESIGAIKYKSGNRIQISEDNTISVTNRQINDVWVGIN